MTNVAEALRSEMIRVRDRVMPFYAGIGVVGHPALFMMRDSLAFAETALAEEDAVACVRALKDLQEYVV